MNTDIQKVFQTLLDTAVKNNVSKDDMIKKIYIISDMEFDAATNQNENLWDYTHNRTVKKNTTETVFQTIRKEYQEKGYDLPLLVFWNVDARHKQFPMTMDDNVRLVSGASPSIFKNLLNDKFQSAYEMMLDVLNDPKYEKVTV